MKNYCDNSYDNSMASDKQEYGSMANLGGDIMRQDIRLSGDDYDDDDDEDMISDNKRTKYDDSSKLKHQDQIDKRREQNRVLARKTRQRKKSFFESLQKKAADLVKENEILKDLIYTQRNEDFKQKPQYSDSNNTSKQPNNTNYNSYASNTSAPTPASNNISSNSSSLGKDDNRLITAIHAANRPYCITNPCLQDNPIVYANKGFMELTGYRLDQILGRNCRFLQGPGTDQRQIAALRKGIAAGADTSVCLLNYRADGSTFYNQIFVYALRNVHNKIISFIGVQVEVKDELVDAKINTLDTLPDFIADGLSRIRQSKTNKFDELIVNNKDRINNSFNNNSNFNINNNNNNTVRPSLNFASLLSGEDTVLAPDEFDPNSAAFRADFEADEGAADGPFDGLSDDDLSFDFDDFLQGTV